MEKENTNLNDMFVKIITFDIHSSPNNSLTMSRQGSLYGEFVASLFHFHRLEGGQDVVR